MLPLFLKLFLLTIFGFARAVIWLQQIAFNTAAGVASFCVRARLTACPIHTALIEIYQAKNTGKRVLQNMLFHQILNTFTFFLK